MGEGPGWISLLRTTTVMGLIGSPRGDPTGWIHVCGREKKRIRCGSTCQEVSSVDDTVRQDAVRNRWLLEECYVLKDPFTSDKDKFLILGSQCSLCSKLVCVGPECSLFYSKRFCLPCVRENLSAFPQEIQQDVEKRHSLSRAASRKLDSRP
ncbi:cysteine-rich DPF motif domain-containing protein 1 isoform X1 [Notamacropus eugenii]|uniref:cysteine-rich DPF motif domain-containing protein 1 isoform X1 n=1 Tax=Notamacropus eugenii TaxID=9315 RepID=UPI003B681948